MTHMVKLAFGKEVTLDEFLTWSAMKQTKNLQDENSLWYRNMMASQATPESKAKRVVAAQKRAEQIRGTKKPHLCSSWHTAPADKKEQAKQYLLANNNAKIAVAL